MSAERAGSRHHFGSAGVASTSPLALRAVPVVIFVFLAVPSALAETFTDATAETCGALWRERNEIFIQRGLCPSVPLARTLFSRPGCTTDDASSIVLDSNLRDEIADIRAREVFLGCQIDVDAETLYEGARNFAVNPGEPAMTWSTSSDHTNVRNGPSSQGFEVIDRLENGHPVEIRERGLNPQGTHRWLRIAYTSDEGQAREGYAYFAQVRAVRRPVAASASFGDFPATSEAAVDRAMLDRITLPQAREAVSSELERGTNFAGSAILATWGCGSGCAMAGIADFATNTWFELPFAMHRDLDQDTPLFAFEPGSTLVVARGWQNEDIPGLFEYHWNGTELTTLADGSGGDSGDYHAQMTQATTALHTGDLPTASQGFRRALAKADGVRNRVAALQGLADAARRAGAFEEGLAYAKRAGQLLPDEPWIKPYIASQEQVVAQARSSGSPSPQTAASPAAAPKRAPEPAPRPLNEFEERAAPTMEALDAVFDLLDPG
jgi:hypothetical protein